IQIIMFGQECQNVPLFHLFHNLDFAAHGFAPLTVWNRSGFILPIYLLAAILLPGFGAPSNSRASSTRRAQLSPVHGQTGGSAGGGPSAAASCSPRSRIDAAIIVARSAGTTLWSSCSCLAGPRPS